MGPQQIILIKAAQLYLVFANQFKWIPNNNIDPKGPSPFNLILANQFKWALYNNI